MNSRLVLLCFVLFLVACTTTAPTANDPVQTVQSDTVAEASAPPPPERAFPDDSLYPLLVAEFAMRRQDFTTALNNYVHQSTTLKDPAVSAQATRLAQFMRQEDKALRAARQWVTLSPDNEEARRTLAMMLARQGDILAALHHMEILARNGKATAFPVLVSKFDQLPTAQQNAAIKQLSALLDDDIQTAQVHLARAFMYETLGKTESALADVNQTLTLEPTNEQAILLEAKLLQDTGASDAFKRLAQTVKTQPGNSRLRLQYARLLTRSNISAARSQYEKLSVQAPQNGELLLSLALINREMKDDLTARAYLKQMLELGVFTDEAHFHLGWIAQDEGLVSVAAKEYLQVREGRLFMRAQQHHGEMLLRKNRLDDFSALFHRQRKQHNWLAESLYALESALLHNTGHTAQSITTLSQGIVQYPASANLRYARAMAYDNLNNLDAMEADLRSVLAHEPDNSTALNALGYTLANKTNRLDEAGELIQRALTISPDEPAILDSMGWLRYRQGHYAQALDYLRRAYQSFPDPEVAAHLGEVLWITGEQDAARAVWQEALSKHANHPVLRETMKRLAKDQIQ